MGYEGWSKSYFPQAWFDSEPEFLFAGIADRADEVVWWVRLLRNDVPIPWRSGGNLYHPDFLLVLTDGVHVIVEIKAEKAASTTEVTEKKAAAQRVMRRASGNASEAHWAYWLITDEDIRTSRRSWRALRAAAEQDS